MLCTSLYWIFRTHNTPVFKSENIGVDFGGQPGHVPPIIEKRPCIYHFLPPQYFGLPTKYFGQVYASDRKSIWLTHLPSWWKETCIFAAVMNFGVILILWSQLQVLQHCTTLAYYHNYNCNHKLQTYRVPIKSWAEGTSLFASTDINCCIIINVFVSFQTPLQSPVA